MNNRVIPFDRVPGYLPGARGVLLHRRTCGLAPSFFRRHPQRFPICLKSTLVRLRQRGRAVAQRVFACFVYEQREGMAHIAVLGNTGLARLGCTATGERGRVPSGHEDAGVAPCSLPHARIHTHDGMHVHGQIWTNAESEAQ